LRHFRVYVPYQTPIKESPKYYLHTDRVGKARSAAADASTITAIIARNNATHTANKEEGGGAQWFLSVQARYSSIRIDIVSKKGRQQQQWLRNNEQE
jgi:hypothetical protein